MRALVGFYYQLKEHPTPIETPLPLLLINTLIKPAGTVYEKPRFHCEFP